MRNSSAQVRAFRWASVIRSEIRVSKSLSLLSPGLGLITVPVPIPVLVPVPSPVPPPVLPPVPDSISSPTSPSPSPSVSASVLGAGSKKARLVWGLSTDAHQEGTVTLGGRVKDRRGVV